jgi:hypothetical protein
MVNWPDYTRAQLSRPGELGYIWLQNRQLEIFLTTLLAKLLRADKTAIMTPPTQATAVRRRRQGR